MDNFKRLFLKRNEKQYNNKIATSLKMKKIKGNKSDPFYYNNYQNNLYFISCIVGMKLSDSNYDFSKQLEYKISYKNITDIEIRRRSSFFPYISRNLMFHFCKKEVPENKKGNLIKSHTYLLEYCEIISSMVKELDLHKEIENALSKNKFSLVEVVGFQKEFIHHYSLHSIKDKDLKEVMNLDTIFENKGNFYEL